jgi:hypothetical protein
LESEYDGTVGKALWKSWLEKVSDDRTIKEYERQMKVQRKRQVDRLSQGGSLPKTFEHKPHNPEEEEKGAQGIEKKDSWDKEERRSGFKERMQRTVHAAGIHGDEEQQALGTKQGKDEERAISGGKVAPSRTVTISGDGKKVKNPKHEVMIDLLHELKALSESTKSALGALGWGKLNRDGSKQKLRKRQPKLDDFVEEKNKFANATEEGNIQLGGQAVPTEKEKLTSSLGAQNKQRKVTISTER